MSEMTELFRRCKETKVTKILINDSQIERVKLKKRENAGREWASRSKFEGGGLHLSSEACIPRPLRRLSQWLENALHGDRTVLGKSRGRTLGRCIHVKVINRATDRARRERENTRAEVGSRLTEGRISNFPAGARHE